MKPVVEMAPFLAVALVVHMGAFALVARGVASAGGDGGAGQITLEGGDPGVAALVAAWDRPPEVVPPPAPAGTAASKDETVTLPQTESSAAPDLPALHPLNPPALPTDPAPDTAPPAPLVALMPEPEPARDAPAFAQAPDQLAQLTTTTQAPALAGLIEPLVNERPDAAPSPLPQTAPPPPLVTAQPPERSPHPPARPAPRRAAQATTSRSAASAPPAQRAAGTGARGHEGQSGPSRHSGNAGADTGGLMAQWGGALRAAVQRQQRHPSAARSGGTVLLRLDIHSDGRLLGVALQQSSGHAALDQAALDAVRRARLPAAPQGLSGSFQFNLPVRFRG